MSRVSPTLEGFRATFQRPWLTFAEIAWRWTVGAIAWALLFFWFIEYLKSLPVTNGDLTLLSTRQPFLVGRAIAHILQGSLERAVFSAVVGLLALSLLWIVIASIGRMVTVRGLLDYFRRNAADVASENAGRKSVLLPLAGINFLRVAVVLASVLAFVGAGVLAGFVSPDTNPRPGLAFLLFLPLAGLICFGWSTLNWLLSLAAVFVVRDGADALGSLSSAVTFSRERLGSVAAVSMWTGLAHLTAFSVASTAVAFPLALVQVVPLRLVIAAMILVTLAYFAVADWLYMARLAGYVCIAEGLDEPAVAVVLPSPMPAATVDREEPILSDVPNPA